MNCTVVKHRCILFVSPSIEDGGGKKNIIFPIASIVFFGCLSAFVDYCHWRGLGFLKKDDHEKQCGLWKGELSASVDNHNTVDGIVKWSSGPAGVSGGAEVS